ncbi:MAG: prepilin-type N-terminal cleavage/methylation domain-containing protein [Nitrospirae bacterium]|nr:MAG: prepilin-type N-terminal cleavage/methylation domain-containing protein [Nitrospirota bacterium]
MKTPIYKFKDTGFTLLELLISITLLGLIVLAIGGSIRLGITSVEKGERQIEKSERLRSVYMLLDRQISSMVKALHDLDGEKVVWFEGDTDTCSFLTERSLWGRKSALVLVRYSFSTDEEGKKALIETESIPWAEEGLKEYTLLSDIEKGEFRYLDTNTDGEKEWVEEWEAKDHFPEAVWIGIDDGRDNLQLLFPVMTLGRTERKTPLKIDQKPLDIRERLFPFFK